ncbi:efflux RND transporter periplasmic adaptor subunit [Flavobacterium frigidarium]|uniref:efflux RND transporter periplasmic adaptor subunit n=1 Tax=Flavobacterium frigidarium TaxID=99286 RepID=UPI0030DCF9CC|tara:strand:+ start:3343 stop:4488 length:1146 start_codon:yes stop_codon:yes gene_type:complete
MRTTLIKSLLLAVLISSCNNKAEIPVPAAPSLPVLTLKSESTATSVAYPAAIQGTVDVEVRSQVNGNLDQVLVDEGAYVRKGQALFKINDRPYREQLNNALANLHAAEAALINSDIEVDKLNPLVKNKVVSDYQLKTAKAMQKVAMANIEQNKAMVASARINLGYTTITAPVSGYIGRLYKKQGSLISSSDVEALTTLSDVHEVYGYFSLSESDFINFKKTYAGNTLSEKLKNLAAVELVLADNSIYEKKGVVDMIDGQFDKNTAAITVRATFPNANGILRSGNTGKVRLQIQHDDAILIPQSATIEMQDKVFAFTVNAKNEVTKTPITISGKSGANYLISEGLKAGDKIVLSGIDKLQEGQLIQPVTKPAKEVAQIDSKK